MVIIPRKDWDAVQHVVQELRKLLCSGAAPELPGSEGVPPEVYKLARQDTTLADVGPRASLTEGEIKAGFRLDEKGMKHCPVHGLVGYGYCISCDGGVF